MRVLSAAAVLGACASTTTETYPDDLGHPNYVKRNRAVRVFATERDVRQLEAGPAWALLMDEDGGIRTVAHVTIRELSPDRRDFGYAPHLSVEVRAGIVARWEAWWRKTGRGADRG